MESSGRWWLVNGQEVDLNADAGTCPPNVRAAVLAHRDASTPEEQDIAAYLEWALTAEPGEAFRVATEFCWTKSQQIYQRLLATIDRLGEAE